MKVFSYILLISLVFTSCGEYQKILKSTDVGKQFKFGDSLYKLGKYSKAANVFEKIIPKYRGKPQAQKLTFLYAKCNYEQKNYFIAASQFDKFVNSYPRSEKKAEAMFLAAKSIYKLSPVYSKDQTDTQQAIDKLQLFINAHRDSEFITEANALVKELDYKLEKKAFEIAKNYYRISEYKASLKAFDQFVFNFPGSVLREKVAFYKFDASALYALNSVDSKMEKRLEVARSNYKAFTSRFPKSEFIEKAEQRIEDINQELNRIKNKA